MSLIFFQPSLWGHNSTTSCLRKSSVSLWHTNQQMKPLFFFFFASHNSPCQAQPPHLLPRQLLSSLDAFILHLFLTSASFLHTAASGVSPPHHSLSITGLLRVAQAYRGRHSLPQTSLHISASEPFCRCYCVGLKCLLNPSLPWYPFFLSF